jgi:drug/metabolite transporter (DMT)-like permease
MKRFSQAALMVVGFGVIVAGVLLIFRHEDYEVAFQNHLLSEFHGDYHWRSIGNAYTGIGAIVVGALMMAVSAVVARLP